MQLKAYISMHKHNFICLSETYLDSTTPDSQFEKNGYNLVRVDHPDNIKKVEFEFTKESLLARIISLSYLKEALL